MQHREWNPKTFFRKVSSEVMALFEQSRALALERDPGRPEHERTYHAWKALPEERRLSLEAELLPVNDLCTQGARPYLDNLARCVWTLRAPELIEESREWSVYDLAMRLHVDAPADFLRCHQNYAVDMMEHFKEYRGRHQVAVHASAEAKAEMKAAMAEHFRQNAGGSRCQVEDFEGDGKLALFIYHEDEVTPVEQFDAAGGSYSWARASRLASTPRRKRAPSPSKGSVSGEAVRWASCAAVSTRWWTWPEVLPAPVILTSVPIG